MRWQPPNTEPTRVIVWTLFTDGTGRKRRWYWKAKSRNGNVLAISVEGFASREQAARAAVMFGGPAKLIQRNVGQVTASHDGQVLPLNWRHLWELA